jgi:hypothetical protein
MLSNSSVSPEGWAMPIRRSDQFAFFARGRSKSGDRRIYSWFLASLPPRDSFKRIHQNQVLAMGGFTTHRLFGVKCSGFLRHEANTVGRAMMACALGGSGICEFRDGPASPNTNVLFTGMPVRTQFQPWNPGCHRLSAPSPGHGWQQARGHQ